LTAGRPVCLTTGRPTLDDKYDFVRGEIAADALAVFLVQTPKRLRNRSVRNWSLLILSYHNFYLILASFAALATMTM
jgi:hypothetical protein